MSTSSTPHELADLFIALYHRVRRLLDEEMAASGTSLSRTKLLAQLVDGPVRQNVLATHLDCAARTVTETVDGLERDGLAERRDDPTDRRAKLVALTDAGRVALAAGVEARDRVRHNVFSALDGPSRAVLADLLRTLDASPALTPLARSTS